MALTGSAGCPQAFPLLKVDRQCCVDGSFSQVDPIQNSARRKPIGSTATLAVLEFRGSQQREP
jgi:hypothetical protein